MADENEDLDLNNKTADNEDENLDGGSNGSSDEGGGPVSTEAEKKSYIRMKKAEEDLKAEKKARKEAEDKLKAKEASDAENADAAIFQEEVRLTARGMSDELIAEAKDIAKGKGISLVEATKTKQFELLEAAEKDEKRKEKAKLAASSGSSGSDGDLSEAFPSGQPKEDHKKAWEKAVGKR